ncbi:MAG: hypothetical protein BGO51_15060 [Rhodospirillales bacterium 69-11]|nr:hypothetical protein [Rhodospirillales bacterium]OJW19444.1 MAG: hypothetical protein BGO51_15060 [Rhodospirillales bacterium 69-11]
MSALFLLPLLVKALTTALLVVSASVAAERLGAMWGAVIASLPVSAGPAYVFLALQHGPGFVAASALSSAVANAATGLFLICYAALATRLSSWRCLVLAIAVWLGASLVARQVAWSAVGAVLVNGAVYAIGLAVLARSRVVAPRPAPPSRRAWFELPLRAVLVAGFVSVVVAGSSAMGPAVTGFAAVFPVSLISLLAILQLRLGRAAAAQVAAKALPPMLGFGGMLLVLHLTIGMVGVAAAMALALAVCLAWSCGLLWLQRGPSWPDP